MAQWELKGWPTDLMVWDSIPADGRNLFNCKLGSIAQSLSLSYSHHPDKTEILFNPFLKGNP